MKKLTRYTYLFVVAVVAIASTLVVNYFIMAWTEPTGIPPEGGVDTTKTLSEVLTDGNDGGGVRIRNIANPVGNQDAATKAYVDSQMAGISAAQLEEIRCYGQGGSAFYFGAWAAATCNATGAAACNRATNCSLNSASASVYYCSWTCSYSG